MTRHHGRWPEIRDIADAQFGLITAAQLATLGVDTRTTSRRVAGYMWTRILPGVHLVDGGHPSRLQREAGALLYAGDGTRVTGTSSLRHHGVRSLRLQDPYDDEPERPEPVHVLIPHARRRASTGYVRIERTHRMPAETILKHGLPVTTVARATADAARRLRVYNDVAAIASEVVQRGLATVEELEKELREGSRRGSAHLRNALGPVARGAWSAPETHLVTLLDRAGLVPFMVNVRVVTESGEYVARPDAWLDDVGLAIEVDSVEHHASGDGFERTARRNTRYARAGVTVVTLTPRDLTARPNGVVADIRRARDAAAEKPRPRVRAVRDERLSAGREAWRWGA